MKKYVFLSYGYVTPTPEIQDAWRNWFASIEDKLVDSGSPFGSGREITHKRSNVWLSGSGGDCETTTARPKPGLQIAPASRAAKPLSAAAGVSRRPTLNVPIPVFVYLRNMSLSKIFGNALPLLQHSPYSRLTQPPIISLSKRRLISHRKISHSQRKMALQRHHCSPCVIPLCHGHNSLDLPNLPQLCQRFQRKQHVLQRIAGSLFKDDMLLWHSTSN